MNIEKNAPTTQSPIARQIPPEETTLDGPRWRIDAFDPASVVSITEEQLSLMGHVSIDGSENLSGTEYYDAVREKVATQGLPVGEGVTPLQVTQEDGTEKVIFINLSPEDYGTTVPESGIEVVGVDPAVKPAESDTNPEARHELIVAQQDLGEQAVQAPVITESGEVVDLVEGPDAVKKENETFLRYKNELLQKVDNWSHQASNIATILNGMRSHQYGANEITSVSIQCFNATNDLLERLSQEWTNVDRVGSHVAEEIGEGFDGAIFDELKDKIYVIRGYLGSMESDVTFQKIRNISMGAAEPQELAPFLNQYGDKVTQDYLRVASLLRDLGDHL